jgi:hypothetical protein
VKALELFIFYFRGKRGPNIKLRTTPAKYFLSFGIIKFIYRITNMVSKIQAL